jgi:hypothetical protein
MNFNVVESAAWVILGTATGQLLRGLWQGKDQELEKDAVLAEYYDDKTSTERKHQLVVRYPQHLISPPNLLYFREAREAARAAKKRSRLSQGELTRLVVGTGLIWGTMFALWHYAKVAYEYLAGHP